MRHGTGAPRAMHTSQLLAIAWRCVPLCAGRFNLLGLSGVPGPLVPLLMLGLTSIIVPTAHFLGHLAGKHMHMRLRALVIRYGTAHTLHNYYFFVFFVGIIAGGVVASGLLWWLTPYWTACVFAWAVIGRYAVRAESQHSCMHKYANLHGNAHACPHRSQLPGLDKQLCSSLRFHLRGCRCSGERGACRLPAHVLCAHQPAA